MKIQKEQMEQQKEQMEQQNEQQKEQMKEQMRIQTKQHEEELAVQREQMELWPDYWSRFCTFLVANAVPDDRKAQVFLTNQTPAVYKQLANLAAQQNPRMNINDLTMDQIVKFMKEQFDPKLFIVRERFKFWSNMERKPGETLQELAARIRQDAATCDFPSIQDPQDEALRQRFICSVNNEAVLKALFKVKDTELDFAKAVKIAIETEDAAKVAKETVYGSKPRPVNKVKMNNKGGRPKNHQQSNSTTSNSAKCYRLDVPVTIQDQQFTMELDTATTGNFVSVPVWKQLGKPKLDDVTHRYESASKHDLPVLGTFMGQTKDPVTGKQSSIPYIVTKIPDLNLLGRNAIQALGISVDNALGLKSIESQVKSEDAKESHSKTSSTTYASLQKDCHTLCDKFPDLFKEELGCLKDFELEVKFKSDAKPVFHKARPVPFALRDDLTKGYEEGIAKGVWKPVQFNDYGTPVVPIRKTNSAGALKPKLRICGDYSVGINDQLADHRHPMPLPEELMQKLGGGFGYTKIDLADAYNQIKLAPESQRRLALSTHRGVLLQQRLPFGIKSAPGYFQEIMENLTSDLPGVAVFQDDILTSGKDAKDHLSNLERLLTRLNDKGLRCRREKCLFAQPSVEYLGHTLSAEGISKGSKVEAVLKMPPPTDVSSLKSFLGSVQFYGKFIPNLATMAEPLYRLTKKANPWKWGEEEQAAFEQLKNVLSSNQVLVHFDPEKPVGLACDASNVGIGAVLFHRYPDGSERPIANVSKTLTAAERNYSQIHKEALAIIYGLRKFYQYLYGQQFILVTDHKPLTALFGPKKGTPLLAANRLARWALWLNQFDYTIEYRKTADHGNADALSRLPSGDDIDFDREESGEDTDMVCAIRVLSLQVKPFDSNILRQESGKDPVIATVMRYVREGWPLKHAEINEEVRKFQKLSDSLSICHGCLIYGTRVVIPQSLQPKILDLLHIGHFGMERMKQLARTAVYWPGIDAAIEMTSRRCDSCGEHQNKPSKPPVHPWMLPEKPWSRVHLDHAINFMGTNWLVITDAYSKYPCIHPTSSTSTRATLDLLEEDFAHFGYPHTLVSDNATTFVSEEFQSWCKERGITHLTGAPYHPATNGAAERLVQTFKQALRKSSLPPKRALQEFLMQYRRMPTSCGFSPSELLMSRQIRTRIDTLLPSPAHIAQGKQSKEASKTQVTPDSGGVAKVTRQYKAGDPVYALYYGPHHAKQPRWVPAVVKKSTDLTEARQKYFTAESMELLFRNVPPDKIFGFLREVNLFRGPFASPALESTRLFVTGNSGICIHARLAQEPADDRGMRGLDVPVTIQDQQFTMELDTATTGNFVSVPVWKQLGKPKLDDVTHRYESASKHDLPVLGTFMGQTKDPVTGKQSSIPYIVTKIHDLNLLGRNAIQALGISVDNALGLKSIESQVKSEGAKESHLKTSSTTYASLQKDCHTLCDKFPDLFKEELGCLKDFELEIKFKSDAKPVFHKARPVPFALRDDLTKGYEEGIAKGVWKPVQFNDYGTPVVPIRKTNSAGALKPKLRICGDYSVGINDQLADHRHPMPLPEELMQKLGGGFGYTKIDLADAYNQIKLAPESQRRLALSTHRGVLLQQRLPFGIKSAPGYFQEIMENLTSDLPGVAVFQDDILTSGKDAKDHLSNLERLLTRLNDKGLRCRREKCLFAQPSVEYLGHTLSAEGISKGSKVEAVLKMPPPTDVSSLKSFLGSVQFYGKFIPNLATMAEPLYRLTKKANPWKWGEEEQAAFEQLKQVLSSDQVLVHFVPEKPVGLACDASNVGIGAVLFHRYPDGSERPIANVSKTLTAAERNYSQIHKEALAIIYGLRKFYQYLYGRQFILVTDHKPLTALFGPKKGTPLLAANRLARWALWLNQFDYTIEYRKTADHGNADALSRLPSGDDIDFDREESGEDTDMVCAIRVLSLQVKPFDANILRQESGKDPVIATVMRYVREGWPLKHAEINEDVRKFQKLSDSLSTCHGCLIYGTRVVIPQSLQPKILDLLHIGHFGMERMKQLARTAVYWPGIDAAIEMTSRRCDSCGEHQNKPSKPPVHPWMLPEKPWSRVHVDHAINFMGTNWLVITDAYSKYPCIHPTSSTSTRATLDLLEEDFAHFGYPHTLVSDNATTFVSEEFQSWCKERGITHLTGAPYHPATNGAAERLVQTFKQALRKSSLPPKRALQEFLMQYRRMPTSCGFSPSELLMSRQIRTRIDTLLTSPAHIAQGKQSKEASKTQVTPDPGGVAKVTRQYKAGDPVYALYCGPHHAKQPRWVPAVVKKSTAVCGGPSSGQQQTKRQRSAGIKLE
nr:hypothetical protein BaRGS_024165 [Batillaria attramentaria]